MSSLYVPYFTRVTWTMYITTVIMKRAIQSISARRATFHWLLKNFSLSWQIRNVAVAVRNFDRIFRSSRSTVMNDRFSSIVTRSSTHRKWSQVLCIYCMNWMLHNYKSCFNANVGNLSIGHWKGIGREQYLLLNKLCASLNDLQLTIECELGYHSGTQPEMVVLSCPGLPLLHHRRIPSWC